MCRPCVRQTGKRGRKGQRTGKGADKDMKTLYLAVGLPRSGKTTRARNMDMPIVNPDSIRIALHGKRFIGSAEPMVWAIARYMVAALFEAGHDAVVLDATNTTVKRRQEWADKRWRRVFIVIPVDEATCIARAQREKDHDIIPIISKMVAQYEPPMDAEIMDWERSGERSNILFDKA